MTTILAAIDDSTAATPVLAVAGAMAALMDATVDVLHVREGDKRTAADVAEQRGFRVRVVEGDPQGEIVRAADDPAVDVVVIGIRGQPAGPRPAGHIALAVLEQVAKPVLAVPPDAPLHHLSSPIRRVLFPLEGTEVSSDAVTGVLHRLAAAGVELLGVHVFDATTVPAFWDEPGHAEQSWANEFVARWCSSVGVDLQLRRGAAPQVIAEVARSENVDLITLGWSQHLGPGRAEVVRAALTETGLPVLLVPPTDGGTDRPWDPGPSEARVVP